MAAIGEPLKKRIRAEASCDLCEGFYTDPVMLRCGSTFCRACVEERSPARCPDCGAAFDPSRLTANRALSRIVEISKELLERDERREASAGRGSGCQQPREETLFCKEEEVLICRTCHVPEEHRGHEVVRAEQAALDYKYLTRKCLIQLKEEEKDILANKTTLELDCQYFFEKTTAAWEKTKTEFQRMEEFLERRKRELLAQVTQVYKEIKIFKNEQISALSRKQSFLQEIHYEMAEARQLPESEFLENIGAILWRFEQRELVRPVGFLSRDLQSKISGLIHIYLFLLDSMEDFRENVTSGPSRLKEITALNPNGNNPSGTSEEPQSVSNLDQAEPSNPGSSELQSE